LYTFTRRIFATLASQNKPERAFNAASHILTDFYLQNALYPEYFDELNHTPMDD